MLILSEEVQWYGYSHAWDSKNGPLEVHLRDDYERDASMGRQLNNMPMRHDGEVGGTWVEALVFFNVFVLCASPGMEKRENCKQPKREVESMKEKEDKDVIEQLQLERLSLLSAQVNEEEHEVATSDDAMEEVLLQALEAHGDKYGNNYEMISLYDSGNIPRLTMDLNSSTNIAVIIIISHCTTSWALTQVILQGFPVMGKSIFQLVVTNGEFLVLLWLLTSSTLITLPNFAWVCHIYIISILLVLIFLVINNCTLVQFERVSLHGNVSGGAPLLKIILPTILVLIWMDFQVTHGCYDLFPAYMQAVLCHALEGSAPVTLWDPLELKAIVVKQVYVILHHKRRANRKEREGIIETLCLQSHSFMVPLHTLQMEVALPFNEGGRCEKPSGDKALFVCAPRILDEASGEAAVVDPVEPQKILQVAEEHGSNIKYVLTTHHHWDHAGGNEEIKKLVPGIKVYGGAKDNVQGCTIAVEHGDELLLGGTVTIKALHTPCHTKGHISYFLTSTSGDDPAVFTGDTLFIAGCGKFFEGSAEQMYESLCKTLASLPISTRVYCGHEYTVKNLQFALTVEPENERIKQKLSWAEQQRKENKFTVPSTIQDELEYNPFMRVDRPELKERIGHNSPVQVIGEIRRMKDSWKG
ncbi:hypothetical protein KI387_026602 [Taxus chinensis]|uniref:hydroxyacylglutathione hydrolase n=1 Tax=Taxus chinensis TaxID=29808 RepID=A0AA38FV09_TAXCH|nr:hypothetical protein KI387_026602 [Taxus chinensis]